MSEYYGVATARKLAYLFHEYRAVRAYRGRVY
jgi:hypothetical protein